MSWTFAFKNIHSDVVCSAVYGMLRAIFFISIFFLFNATFNNISALSCRPVLVVEEAGVSGEIRRPWASNW
jgi:hypothetical protein